MEILKQKDYSRKTTDDIDCVRQRKKKSRKKQRSSDFDSSTQIEEFRYSSFNFNVEISFGGDDSAKLSGNGRTGCTVYIQYVRTGSLIHEAKKIFLSKNW